MNIFKNFFSLFKTVRKKPACTKEDLYNTTMHVASLLHTETSTYETKTLINKSVNT